MTGFTDLFIAIKPTNAGNYAIEAVMGPADVSFANLNPVDAASGLAASHVVNNAGDDFSSILNDTASALTADVWNILWFLEVLKTKSYCNLRLLITVVDLPILKQHL